MAFPLCCTAACGGHAPCKEISMKSYHPSPRRCARQPSPAYAADAAGSASECRRSSSPRRVFPIPAPVPVGVTVITAQDIRNSTASTVPDCCAAGRHRRPTTCSGTPNLQVDLRGFGIFGDQNTLILLDGRRISENEQLTVQLVGDSARCHRAHRDHARQRRGAVWRRAPPAAPSTSSPRRRRRISAAVVVQGGAAVTTRASCASAPTSPANASA